MNDWENFNETSLPEKEDFWSQLNMKYLTDEDCTHTKIVCKGFKIKIFRIISWLNFQSNKLLLSDVFENFRNMYFETYEIDPENIFSAPGLAWQLKKLMQN